MIFRDGDKINVQGAVTVKNVVAITQQGLDLFNSSNLVVDLAKVTEVDSSIVSMLMEWLRWMRKRDYQLQFTNIPESLESLIQLYGVSELIPRRKIVTNPTD